MTKKILVVDDDADSADMHAVLLRLFGHEVLSLTEGERAIEAAQSFVPDLILLDIGLPRIDGYEIARRIRRAGCTARLVAVTGYGRPEDRIRALEAGFDHHLLKPVEPEALQRLTT
jgi:two-component system, chemotaxis family, CheB/CheR fusion protein